MPSAWEWWAGEEGDNYYAFGSAGSRDEAIRLGLREVEIGERFQIIEARSSTAKKYDGGDYDFVPFTHTRNHEVVTKGVQPWEGDREG